MALAWWLAIGSAIDRGTDGRAARCTTAVGAGEGVVEQRPVEDAALDQPGVDAVEVGPIAGRQVVERHDLGDRRRRRRGPGRGWRR